MAVLLLGGSATLGKRQSKQALKSKQHNINLRIRAVKRVIWQKELKKRSVASQLQQTQRQLDNVQTTVSQNKLKLLKAQSDLDHTTVTLNRTKRQLERRRGLLTRRVVDIYEGDDLGYANVILGASDMWTFLTRAYYLQKILDADATLIAQIRADKIAIEVLRARQAKRVNQIGSLQVQLVSQRDRVDDLKQDQKDQISAIEHDKDIQEKFLDELEAESQRIENDLRAFASTPRGRALASRAFTGGLSVPVYGRITSRFGYRHHPITGIYKLHTGVDLEARTGTPVHAAADGVVYKACWQGAYGNAVTIQHGGNVSTLYGHCSRLAVRAGQQVRRGQVIGYAGSTGSSTGPHVHFEKRVYGRPVNPM